jgi:hypothetical protein
MKSAGLHRFDLKLQDLAKSVNRKLTSELMKARTNCYVEGTEPTRVTRDARCAKRRPDDHLNQALSIVTDLSEGRASAMSP